MIELETFKDLYTEILPYVMQPDRNIKLGAFNSLHYMSTIINEENIEGDIIECGVYAGGQCILLSKLFPQKSIWLMDSFEGCQGINEGKFKTTSPDEGNQKGNFPYSLDDVKDNFIKCGVNLDEKIKFIKGWFRDTLYDETIILPEKISILRIDSDGYSSYLEVLTKLYDRVVPGGFIIFDDYLFPAISQRALPLFFSDKKMPVIWRPNGEVAAQIGKPESIQRDDHVACYMRKDRNDWKPNMKKYNG